MGKGGLQTGGLRFARKSEKVQKSGVQVVQEGQDMQRKEKAPRQQQTAEVTTAHPSAAATAATTPSPLPLPRVSRRGARGRSARTAAARAPAAEGSAAKLDARACGALALSTRDAGLRHPGADRLNLRAVATHTLTGMHAKPVPQARAS